MTPIPAALALPTQDVGAPTPRELAAAQAAQTRAEAQQAIENARQAISNANDAGRNAAQLPAPGRTVIVGADGKRIEIQTGPDAPPPPAVFGEGITVDTGPGPEAAIAMQVKETVGIVGGVIVGTMFIWLFFRTAQKWIESRRVPTALPRDAIERLARIETAIEAMAVEVERISEGQRFTTRLLSERAPTPVERG